MHPTSDVRECDALVYSVFEERDCPISRIIEDAEACGSLFALAAVAENGARLQPILVDADQFERPHVPVDARR